MSQYNLSISQYPTMPAWYVSEDEGEAWECGDYICFLQKHPPLQTDAMSSMLKNLPTKRIPPSDSKGLRYLFVLSMFYKKGRNPSGKDSSLPAEVMTIEQVNAAMLLGGPTRWDKPVLCSFKPSGRWNSERRMEIPVSKDAARTAFFDELARRALPPPSRIGNIMAGMDVLRGKSPNSGTKTEGDKSLYFKIAMVMSGIACYSVVFLPDPMWKALAVVIFSLITLFFTYKMAVSSGRDRGFMLALKTVVFFSLFIIIGWLAPIAVPWMIYVAVKHGKN